MDNVYFDKRESGIAPIGDVPWGTCFCQFYQTEQDLFDVLVPYFKAGLENNEYCIWVTTASALEKTQKALKKASSDFRRFVEKKQIEIVSQSRWYTRGKKRGDVIISRLDEAVLRGFDGLRLAIAPFLENEGGKASYTAEEADTISRFNAIAVFTYPRSRFDAVQLMEVIKNYRFALVQNKDKLELISSSEARIAKDALISPEEILRSLFKYMAEGVAHHRIVLDNSGKPCDYVFLEINEAFEKMVGLKAKDILGKRVTQVLPGIENDSAGWIGRYGKISLTGTPELFESYSDVLQKWYSVSAFSTHKGFFTVTLSDITERKEAEEELKRINIELEASNKELEAFSYSVSHDLRAPLRSMEGFSSALLEDYAEKLDGQGKQYLRYIQDSSDLMGRLIDDLLRLSRVTRSDMDRQRVNLSEMAQKIAAEFEKAEPRQNLELIVAPDIMAYGDRNLLRVALENLLGNAWKFSGKVASPRIEMGIGEHNGKQAYFIRDNGVGFDMTYADKLFKPFQRLHKASEFGGSGIGLATVQRIIHRHGGEVWAESKPGEGATFYFTLG